MDIKNNLSIFLRHIKNLDTKNINFLSFIKKTDSTLFLSEDIHIQLLNIFARSKPAHIYYKKILPNYLELNEVYNNNKFTFALLTYIYTLDMEFDKKRSYFSLLNHDKTFSHKALLASVLRVTQRYLPQIEEEFLKLEIKHPNSFHNKRIGYDAPIAFGTVFHTVNLTLNALLNNQYIKKKSEILHQLSNNLIFTNNEIKLYISVIECLRRCIFENFGTVKLRVTGK